VAIEVVTGIDRKEGAPRKPKKGKRGK
jgi:hypothetical protein